MDDQNTLVPKESDFLLYTTPEGDARVFVFFQDDNVWLSQKRMAELFGVDVRTVNEHLTNVFKSAELSENAVIRNFRITAADGKKYDTKFYSLDAIIAVGYRVHSSQASHFRKWATVMLREFMVKGYVLDDDRMKRGQKFGQDYFDELLERIREIRASERRFYQKITDLYVEASIDYDEDAEITKKFFQMVQNKLHWAITGMTAAELIAGRADSAKPKMGLLTWKRAPKGKIMKSDVSVAKNYLGEEEVGQLDRIVAMYLDYAENLTKLHKQMTMAEWVQRLDAFLRFNEREVLDHAGKVTAEVAKELAETEYAKYRVIQDHEYQNKFDAMTEGLIEQTKQEVLRSLKEGDEKEEQ